MDLTSEPPPHLPFNLSPFPPYKPPDPFFPPDFDRPAAAFHPGAFLHTPRIVSVRRLEIQNEVVENLRGPLTFHHNCQFQSWNQTAAEGVTPAHFREAASLVIATLDRGYFRNKTEPLLAAPEWAELACAVVAATGRGYARSHKADDPDSPYTDRLASFDTAMDDSKFPFDTLFHRLRATAEALQTYVEGDDQVANWLRDTEEETIDLL